MELVNDHNTTCSNTAMCKHCNSCEHQAAGDEVESFCQVGKSTHQIQQQSKGAVEQRTNGCGSAGDCRCPHISPPPTAAKFIAQSVICAAVSPVMVLPLLVLLHREPLLSSISTTFVDFKYHRQILSRITANICRDQC